jgi:hypothetical protein
LTALGFDVTCVRDRGLHGDKDWDLMEWCANEGRAICTKNRRHFEREHARWFARGEIHFGIVIVGDWTAEQHFLGLQAFLEGTEDIDLLGQLVVLDEP